MGGVSSIHVTKSSTNCAYLAKPCAALFPSLLVWRVLNWLNICMWCMVPAIILAIAGEGSDSPLCSWANQLAVTFKNYLMETNIFGKYDSLLQCFRFDFQRSQWELQLLTHGSNHQALVISCYHTNSAPFVFRKNSPIHIHLIPSIACGEKFCKLIIWRDKTKTKENHEDDNGMKWQSILWE